MFRGHFGIDAPYFETYFDTEKRFIDKIMLGLDGDAPITYWFVANYI